MLILCYPTQFTILSYTIYKSAINTCICPKCRPRRGGWYGWVRIYPQGWDGVYIILVRFLKFDQIMDADNFFFFTIPHNIQNKSNVKVSVIYYSPFFNLLFSSLYKYPLVHVVNKLGLWKREDGTIQFTWDEGWFLTQTLAQTRKPQQ